MLITVGCFFCTSSAGYCPAWWTYESNEKSLSPLCPEWSDETSGKFSWSKQGLRAGVIVGLNSFILRGSVLVHNQGTTEEEDASAKFVEVFFLWETLRVCMKLTPAFYGHLVCTISLRSWQQWSKQWINIYPQWKWKWGSAGRRI